MNIPGALTVTSAAYGMDGGSISILCVDPEKTQHAVYLPQWEITEKFDLKYIAGRLHWDGAPVPIRSSEEDMILSLLESAGYESVENGVGDRIAPKERRVAIGGDVSSFLDAIDESPNAAMKHLVQSVVNFVRSEQYLDVARTCD